MVLRVAPLVVSCSSGEFGVSEALNQQIDRLQEIYKSELDPQGRAFVPLADQGFGVGVQRFRRLLR